MKLVTKRQSAHDQRHHNVVFGAILKYSIFHIGTTSNIQPLNACNWFGVNGGCQMVTSWSLGFCDWGPNIYHFDIC